MHMMFLILKAYKKIDKNIANAKRNWCVVAFDESIKINDSLSTSDESSAR